MCTHMCMQSVYEYFIVCIYVRMQARIYYVYTIIYKCVCIYVLYVRMTRVHV